MESPLNVNRKDIDYYDLGKETIKSRADHESDEARYIIESFFKHDVKTVVDALIKSVPEEFRCDKRAVAIAIHNFVRDQIKFGFTKKFDLATA